MASDFGYIVKESHYSLKKQREINQNKTPSNLQILLIQLSKNYISALALYFVFRQRFLRSFVYLVREKESFYPIHY